MRILRTVEETRALVASWRRANSSVGFVPTMGALHAGHLSLVSRAKQDCVQVLATVFVNPLQFGPTEDFDKYPRQEEQDFEKLVQLGCSAVFAPTAEEIFPDRKFTIDEYPTTVSVPGLSSRWCGAHRPGHFTGVATEVLKFLLVALPDVAYFGEKDYQQLQVIKQMVRDLSVPVRVQSVPTVREADGLACSSRNAYLTSAQRKSAPKLFETLSMIARNARQQEPQRLLEVGTKQLLEAGFRQIEYLAVVDGETLEPSSTPTPGCRVLGAGWLDNVRLIDNVAVS